MLNRLLTPLCLGLTLISSCTPALADDKDHAVFTLVVYKDDQCKVKYGDVKIDTSKACVSYSYVDSKGKTTYGSMNNIRCSNNNVVVDKYPFTGDCIAKNSVHNGQEIYTPNYSMPIDTVGCQKAISHEGFVYEQIIDYVYPGNVDCTFSKKAAK